MTKKKEKKMLWNYWGYVRVYKEVFEVMKVKRLELKKRRLIK